MSNCTKCNKPNDNKKSIWCFSCIEQSKKPVKEEKIIIKKEVKKEFIITKGSFFDRFYGYIDILNKK